ncbi:aldehyde reductase 1 [Cystobasidium minutum MCA 4210]|uniref:aldehyde reductase 1 n=1 Tax=Cystobasidium minutum MCA 4210 TaxID=1397322 RepID=UPI0034CF94AC|eukprot:jgi/Rhomi1/196032/gm1.4246_g
MAAEFPSFELPSGDKIPGFGLGTWQSAPGEVAKARWAVEVALKSGYRLIDTAAIYGNEKEVGDGIKAAGIPRKDIWVTTKLWNTAHDPKDVLPAFEKSLKDLGLDYIDLYLMHYPCAMDPNVDGIKVLDIPYTATWAAMEALLKTGKCKNIGISNFSKGETEELLANCKVRPAVHQMERHPYLPQHKFVAWHKEIGMHVTAYSPLGNTNPSYAEQDKAAPIVKHKTVTKLAEKYSATPAQILISLQIADGVSVIPKSVTEKRIVENAKFIPLTKEDVEELYSTVTERARYCDFSDVIGYHYYADLAELEGEA